MVWVVVPRFAMVRGTTYRSSHRQSDMFRSRKIAVTLYRAPYLQQWQHASSILIFNRGNTRPLPLSLIVAAQRENKTKWYLPRPQRDSRRLCLVIIMPSMQNSSYAHIRAHTCIIFSVGTGQRGCYLLRGGRKPANLRYILRKANKHTSRHHENALFYVQSGRYKDAELCDEIAARSFNYCCMYCCTYCCTYCSILPTAVQYLLLQPTIKSCNTQPTNIQSVTVQPYDSDQRLPPFRPFVSFVVAL